MSVFYMAFEENEWSCMSGSAVCADGEDASFILDTRAI